MRTPVLGFLAAALMGTAAGGAAMAGGGRTGPVSAALTDAERAPLVAVNAGGERRLRHAALGFSILHPGASLVEAPQIATAMEGKRRDPGTQHYAFADPGGTIMVLSVMKGMGGTLSSLTEHVDAFQRDFSASPSGGADLRWLGREISWSEKHHDARLKAALRGNARLELASHAVTRPGQPPFIVNVMVVSRDIERYAKLLASFRSAVAERHGRKR